MSWQCRRVKCSIALSLVYTGVLPFIETTNHGASSLVLIMWELRDLSEDLRIRVSRNYTIVHLMVMTYVGLFDHHKE